MLMPATDRNIYRARCDAARTRHQCSPATTAFACSVCPATLVCDVPLKRRSVLFSIEEPRPATRKDL